MIHNKNENVFFFVRSLFSSPALDNTTAGNNDSEYRSDRTVLSDFHAK